MFLLERNEMCQIVYELLGLLQQVVQTKWLKWQNCIILQSRGSESETEVSAGLFLLWTVRENVCHASPLASGGLLTIFGIPSLVGISLHLWLHPHMSLSLCASFSKFPCFIKVYKNHIGFGIQLNPVWPHHHLINHICDDPIPSNVTFWGLGS